jgi:hypothetical protein
MSVLQVGKIEWSLAAVPHTWTFTAPWCKRMNTVAARFTENRCRTVPTVEGANDAVG